MIEWYCYVIRGTGKCEFGEVCVQFVGGDLSTEEIRSADL